MSQPQEKTLTAQYQSPGNQPFIVTNAIPAPPSDSLADKTAYLEALRKAVSSTQDSINKELTARMDEDKDRDASAGSSSRKGVDDLKEEENYGEEVQEEED
jgi:hypothetical protein